MVDRKFERTREDTDLASQNWPFSADALLLVDVYLSRHTEH